MTVLHHVLDDMRLALVELDPGESLILFVLKRQVLAELVDELAMCTVVVLCPDVALYQNIDLYRGVDGQGEQSFSLVVVQAILPVDAILAPHLPESL